MKNGIRRSGQLVMAALVTVAALGSAGAGSAQAAPVKLVLNSGRIGHAVKEVSFDCGENIGIECQAGEESSLPGGFAFPMGVASAESGDVYVADFGNHRVQKLNSKGEFVLMFGKGVNATTHGNVCTAEEIEKAGVVCKEGVETGSAEGFADPQDVVVEPGSEDVYVLDFENARLEKYSPSGTFIYMIGKEVNTTAANKNMCTAAETVHCKSGTSSDINSKEAGAFDFEPLEGDLLADVGASEHVLYVGDGHRVQKFSSSGEFLGEIPMTATILASAPTGQITAIAASAQTVFVVYQNESTVFEFDAVTGAELSKHVSFAPNGSGPQIWAIALDASEHLAVSGSSTVSQNEILRDPQVGMLYEASSGKVITAFTVPGFRSGHGVNGLAFAAGGELYSAATEDRDLMTYTPKAVVEATTLGAECVAGPENDTDVTLGCKFNGEVDPWGVTGTSAWFEWGRTPELGEETPHQPVANPLTPVVEAKEEPEVPVSVAIEGMRPNETVYDRLVATDDNVRAAELLTGETLSFTTPAAPPKVTTTLAALFVRVTSAVLFGELNPENSSTTYGFQYAPTANCELLEAELGSSVEVTQCPGEKETEPLKSAAYRRLGATAEASGLSPTTAYRYRLKASNTAGSATSEGEEEFTTSQSPVVQAVTGAYGGVTATSAIVAGSVEADGQASTFTFELGVANGTDTQYDIVASGAVPAVRGFVSEAVGVSGLQPGTQYAYRIGVHFGDGSTPGSSAIGAPQVFTTNGIAVVLEGPPSLPMLEVPPIQFPKQLPVSQQKLTNAQKLAQALKACRKKAKHTRASCERKARRRYGKKSNAKS